MNRHPKRFALVALSAVLGLAFTACETPVQVQKFPEMTFTHLAPINLDVANVEVVTRYQPPMKAPNVDHLVPTPPIKALRQWAADRLKPVGRSGTAQLVVYIASVVETPLEKKTGFQATFTKQQAQRYDFLIEASLEVADGRRRGRAEARVTRFTTMREDASLNERDRIWFKESEAIMAAFNAEMEKNVRQYLGDWLK
jgi:hypothetical protein